MRNKVCCVVFLLLCCAGCRVKAPTIAEQELLMQRGTFGTSSPAWLARSVRPAQIADGDTGGLLSLNTSGRTFSNASSEPTEKSVMNPLPPEAPIENLSPLEKISRLCPTLESEVNDAITSVDVIDRVQKYEVLSRRCDQSSDLLIWLTQDYVTLQDLTAARRTLDRVRVLDPNNPAVNELSEQINSAKR